MDLAPVDLAPHHPRRTGEEDLGVAGDVDDGVLDPSRAAIQLVEVFVVAEESRVRVIIVGRFAILAFVWPCCRWLGGVQHGWYLCQLLPYRRGVDPSEPGALLV